MEVDIGGNSVGTSSTTEEEGLVFPRVNRSLMASPLSNEPMPRSRSPELQASLIAASDVVQSLFGVNVGPCWGEFVCSHNRLRGRLFAVTNGLMFYSNILGFERRLCLRFVDTISLSLYRTTSIRIEVSALKNEIYVFKSFQNREQVLQLLRGLKGFVDKKITNRPSNIDSPADDNNLNVANYSFCEPEGLDRVSCIPPISSFETMRTSTSFSSSILPLTPMVTPQNRRRAVSDSVLRLIDIKEDRCDPPGSDDGFPYEYSADGDLKELWEIASHEITLLEIAGLEPLRLACSLDRFYDLFLVDDAPHSFDRYQREFVRDRDVSISPWVFKASSGTAGSTNDNTVQVCSRILAFTHVLKSALGVGPSEARTTRRQLMHRYGEFGLSVENNTTVEGIPAADTFSVHDFWRIEADGENHVVVTTRFAPRFHKRTLLKGLIEKNVTKETKEWFTGYAMMLKEAVRDEKPSTSSREPDPVRQTSMEAVSLEAVERSLWLLCRISLAGILLLFLVVVVLVALLVVANQTIAFLKAESIALQRENGRLLDLQMRSSCPSNFPASDNMALQS